MEKPNMDINKTLKHISELNAEVSSLKRGIQEEIANAIGVASFQVRIQTHQVVIEMDPERKYQEREKRYKSSIDPYAS
jgi:peptide deformylase